MSSCHGRPGHETFAGRAGRAAGAAAGAGETSVKYNTSQHRAHVTDTVMGHGKTDT